MLNSLLPTPLASCRSSYLSDKLSKLSARARMRYTTLERLFVTRVEQACLDGEVPSFGVVLTLRVEGDEIDGLVSCRDGRLWLLDVVIVDDDGGGLEGLALMAGKHQRFNTEQAIAANGICETHGLLFEQLARERLDTCTPLPVKRIHNSLWSINDVADTVSVLAMVHRAAVAPHHVLPRWSLFYRGTPMGQIGASAFNRQVLVGEMLCHLSIRTAAEHDRSRDRLKRLVKENSRTLERSRVRYEALRIFHTHYGDEKVRTERFNTLVSPDAPNELSTRDGTAACVAILGISLSAACDTARLRSSLSTHERPVRRVEASRLYSLLAELIAALGTRLDYATCTSKAVGNDTEVAFDRSVKSLVRTELALTTPLREQNESSTAQREHLMRLIDALLPAPSSPPDER